MGKFLIVGIFLAIVCCLADVEATPSRNNSLLKLTRDQVRSFLKFVIDNLTSIELAINEISSSATQYGKSVSGYERPDDTEEADFDNK